MMFVPELYRSQKPEWALDLVRANPLALLVTAEGDRLHATNLPVIPEPAGLPAATGDLALVGATLVGHLNRTNPHWAALERPGPALLVFGGAGTYISPTVYDTDPAAPTWNFTTVQLRGTVRPLPDAERLAVIRNTVTALERDHGTGWDMTGSLGYFDELLPGVGAFRFTVTEAEAMFKLSQEKTPEVRDRVRTALACSASGRARDVAAAMDRHGSAS